MAFIATNRPVYQRSIDHKFSENVHLIAFLWFFHQILSINNGQLRALLHHSQ